MGALLLKVILFIFFIWYLIRLLRFWGKQSSSEPFWVQKEIGVGIGINPRNTAGFWVSLAVTLSVLIVLSALIVSFFLQKSFEGVEPSFLFRKLSKYLLYFLKIKRIILFRRISKQKMEVMKMSKKSSIFAFIVSCASYFTKGKEE